MKVFITKICFRLSLTCLENILKSVIEKEVAVVMIPSVEFKSSLCRQGGTRLGPFPELTPAPSPHPAKNFLFCFVFPEKIIESKFEKQSSKET